MEKNLATGSVFKNIVLFSLPYLLSCFLQTLYGLADLTPKLFPATLFPMGGVTAVRGDLPDRLCGAEETVSVPVK